MARVFVVGATGTIGQASVRALRQLDLSPDSLGGAAVAKAPITTAHKTAG